MTKRAGQIAERAFLRFFWPLLAVLVAIPYAGLILRDPILARDDQLFLIPLSEVWSFADWLHFVTSPWNPDFQPLRDLSLMIDVLLARVLPFTTFHLHNVLLWIFCSFCFYQLAKGVEKNENVRKCFTLLFALHPVYMMSVGWISSRKHLLSFTFLLLSLLAARALRRSRGSREGGLWGAALCLAFAGCVFSQPISVFWPIWLAWMVATEWRKDPWFAKHVRVWGPILALLLLEMLLALVVHHRHYSENYQRTQTVLEKFAALEVWNFGAKPRGLLAFGRYFFQLLLPFRLTPLYSPESWANVAGLALGALLMGGSVFSFGWRWASQVWVFFVLLLLLVVTRVGWLFVVDTYILGASLAFWFLVHAWWASAPEKWRRFGRPLFSLLVVFFLARSADEAKNWQSDEAMWRYSFAEEPTCRSALMYAVSLLQRDATAEIKPAVDFAAASGCREADAGRIIDLGLYYDDRLAPEQKIHFLRRGELTESRRVILAALELEAGHGRAAEDLLNQERAANPNFWSTLTRGELRPLAIALHRHCGEHGAFPYCGLLRERR